MEQQNNSQFPIPPKPANGPLPPPPQRPGNNSGSVRTLKIITGVLCVALVASLIVLYSVWEKGNQIQTEKEEIVTEKEMVTADLEKLKGEYEGLRTNNDTLNAQLSQEKQKIEVLLTKIRNTDASNKNKFREYEKEIAGMRTLLSDYVKQIDELSAANKQLRAENDRVKSEATQSAQKVAELTQETGNLKTMVEKGSELKARDLIVTALSDRDKVVGKARQVSQIRACLTLVENSIAKMGSRSVYVRVKAPDGSLLTQSPTNLFSPADGGPQLIYSGMRDVDYNGQDLEVCIFYKDSDFISGTYNVEAYLDGTYIGSTQLVLK